MNFYKNIQFQQNINLFLLLLLAYFQKSLQINFSFLFVLMLYTLFLELFFNKIFLDKIIPPFAALNTLFGIVLMIGWSRWYIPFFLVTVALLQKKVIKVNNCHIFNPSNFAVIFALLFFYPKALPLIGQLGKEYFVLILIVVLALFILIRVQRVVISFSFILFYIFFEYLFIRSYEPTWHISSFLTKFFSTSFIVYIFFMLTDPATTPKKAKDQLLFGAFVALLSALFDYFEGIHTRNLFIALFIVSFLHVFRKIKKRYFYAFIIGVIVFYLFHQKAMVFYYTQ